VATASCVLKTSAGDINLSPLKSSSYYQVTADHKSFYVNICGNAIKSCNGQDYASMYFLSTSDSDCYYLGQLSQMKLSPLSTSDPKKGVSLVYGGGKTVVGLNRKTKISLKCNQNVKLSPSQLKMTFLNDHVDGTDHYFNFEMETKYACPVSNRRRVVGFGGALLIILPCLFCIYMLVGSLVMKFHFKKEGTDIIIHYQYLKEIPLLIWEGILFIKEGVMALVNKASGRSGYETLQA